MLTLVDQLLDTYRAMTTQADDMGTHLYEVVNVIASFKSIILRLQDEQGETLKKREQEYNDALERMIHSASVNSVAVSEWMTQLAGEISRVWSCLPVKFQFRPPTTIDTF